MSAPSLLSLTDSLASLLVAFMFGALAALAVAAYLERRDRRTDELLRRGMRSAWRRGWIKDGDQ